MKNVDRSALYDVADAIALVKKNASAKFDETVEAVSYTHLSVPLKKSTIPSRHTGIT